MEEKQSFRWYEFGAYGEPGSPTQTKIESELHSVYNGLISMMGHATGRDYTVDDMIKFAEEQGREQENGTLADVLKKLYGISEHDEKKSEKADKDESKKDTPEELAKKAIRDRKLGERTEIADRARVKLKEMLESGEVTPVQGKILEAYLQSYTAYGTGARDNVVTSATLLTVGSLNARIGCGQGKTDISKAFAMAKDAEGKRPVITSSTPELAGQSFDELFKGLNQAGLTVVYLSGDEISFADGKTRDKDGKLAKQTKKVSDMTPDEIKKWISESKVVISDLASLAKFKEQGIYVPDRENDVLLQDEQDADIFNNLWDIEVKGDAYDKATHETRLAARREAANAVKQLGASLKGTKIAQAVTLNDAAPSFNVNGNTISIDGTEVSFEIPEGVSSLEMQEFVLDAMLAAKVFNNPGKDYVVKDGVVQAISPSTGAREDIPEGVLQAIAVNEQERGTISEVQPEYEVISTVSKLAFMKESFGQIDGMSATYGRLGSDVSKEFLELLTDQGVSPELIPVTEIYKSKGRIPNFENIKVGEPPEEALTIADAKGELESVEVTIKGEKVVKDNIPPHIAAIVRDIEAHKDEAIMIATNDRSKTEEIAKELALVYGDSRAIEAYSGVPDKDGNPQLLTPPNPAKDEKLEITPPRIVIGDHAIGRGVTPKNKAEVGEHLIVAQMPSRSEALLEQFLGRVGRKDNDGSVSFVLSNEDEIVTEYAEQTGELPTKASEIIEGVYQEKTKQAIESTRSDIALSKTVATSKMNIMRSIILETLHPGKKIYELSPEEQDRVTAAFEDREALQQLLEENPKCIEALEEGAKVTQEVMKLYSKQYKIDSESLSRESADFAGKVVGITMERMQKREQAQEQEQEQGQEVSQDIGREIEAMTMGARYSNVAQMMTRAKELQAVYERGQEEPVHDNDDMTK